MKTYIDLFTLQSQPFNKEDIIVLSLYQINTLRLVTKVQVY